MEDDDYDEDNNIEQEHDDHEQEENENIEKEGNNDNEIIHEDIKKDEEEEEEHEDHQYDFKEDNKDTIENNNLIKKIKKIKNSSNVIKENDEYHNLDKANDDLINMDQEKNKFLNTFIKSQTLNNDQLDRIEASRRSFFKKSDIRKCMADILGPNARIPKTMLIVMSSVAKLFVQDIVEKALDLRAEKDIVSDASINPDEIVEAYQTLQDNGAIVGKKRRLFRR